MKPQVRALLIGLFVVPCAAQGQELTPARKDALQGISAPDGQSVGASLLDVATIEAGTSDTKASITFSGFIPDAGTGSWYQTFSVGGEAAVTKGSTDDATVGTLSGLSKGSSARASYSWIHWARMGPTEFDLRAEFCRRNFKDLIGKHSWEESALAGGNAGCDTGLFTEARLKALVDTIEVARKECIEGKSTLDPGICQRLKDLGEAKLPTGAALSVRLDRIRSKWVEMARDIEAKDLERPAHFITVAAKVNRAKANYFAETDLTTLVKDHSTGYGGTASYSRFYGRRLLSAGFSIEKSYKANDEVEVCSPIAGTTSLKCITGPIGPPKDSFARIAHAEARWLSRSARIAVAPRMEYDFTGSTFAVRVPVYLAPDKKKSLIGGIALGYTDKDDAGFGVSVFVGKAFSFFE
jgi:hypothetical protein